jgi:hypothetical protein
MSQILSDLKNLVIGVMNLRISVGEYKISFMELAIGYFILYSIFKVFYGTVGKNGNN